MQIFHHIQTLRQALQDQRRQGNRIGFVRYLIARAVGLYVGLDYARSEDDEAFYIQVGNGWR